MAILADNSIFLSVASHCSWQFIILVIFLADAAVTDVN